MINFHFDCQQRFSIYGKFLSLYLTRLEFYKLLFCFSSVLTNQICTKPVRLKSNILCIFILFWFRTLINTVSKTIYRVPFIAQVSYVRCPRHRQCNALLCTETYIMPWKFYSYNFPDRIITIGGDNNYKKWHISSFYTDARTIMYIFRRVSKKIPTVISVTWWPK